MQNIVHALSRELDVDCKPILKFLSRCMKFQKLEADSIWGVLAKIAKLSMNQADDVKLLNTVFSSNVWQRSFSGEVPRKTTLAQTTFLSNLYCAISSQTGLVLPQKLTNPDLWPRAFSHEEMQKALQIVVCNFAASDASKLFLCPACGLKPHGPNTNGFRCPVLHPEYACYFKEMGYQVAEGADV